MAARPVSSRPARRPAKPTPAAEPSTPAAPASEAQYLSRQEAAEWFASRGIRTITKVQLDKLAERREGPRYSRLGRAVFYTPADLDAWLQASMRPVEQTGAGGGARSLPK